jgi:hypothetical protein
MLYLLRIAFNGLLKIESTLNGQGAHRLSNKPLLTLVSDLHCTCSSMLSDVHVVSVQMDAFIS